jgi:hypothetical protein
LILYAVDIPHIYFFHFFELVLIIILKLFYNKIIIFNTPLGLFVFLYCFYLALLAYVFMCLNLKEISRLMMFSFCKYSVFCIIMAWWWSELGAETSHPLRNVFIKLFWLWLEKFRSFLIWFLLHKIALLMIIIN